MVLRTTWCEQSRQGGDKDLINIKFEAFAVDQTSKTQGAVMASRRKAAKKYHGFPVATRKPAVPSTTIKTDNYVLLQDADRRRSI